MKPYHRTSALSMTGSTIWGGLMNKERSLSFYIFIAMMVLMAGFLFPTVLELLMKEARLF